MFNRKKKESKGSNLRVPAENIDSPEKLESERSGKT